MRRVTTWVAAVALSLAAAMGAAQEPAPTPAPRETDTLGWYVVRPGDTLEKITERFLGTPVLWRENWRLNPWLENPHLLHAGDRLRVIVSRTLPPRSAKLEKVSRRVEEKPHPNPWVPARGATAQEAKVARTAAPRSPCRRGRRRTAPPPRRCSPRRRPSSSRRRPPSEGARRRGRSIQVSGGPPPVPRAPPPPARSCPRDGARDRPAPGRPPASPGRVPRGSA